MGENFNIQFIKSINKKDNNSLLINYLNDNIFDSKKEDDEEDYLTFKEDTIRFPNHDEFSTKPTNFDDINNNTGQLNHINNKLNNEKENNNTNKLEDNVLIGNKRERIKTRKHTKYSDDNIRRTCKHIILTNLFDFINKKISEQYNNKIGKGVYIKKLLIINQEQKCNSKSKFNKEFLNKSLKDIFSENISKRYTYPPDHNKDLINRLMNEEDEKKRIFFNNLFNLTFLECLKHFRGDYNISELEGLSGLDEIKKKYKNDIDYLNLLNYYFLNFEDITNKKRTNIKREHGQ